MWFEKVSGKEERVTESAYNVFIKSFSKAGVITNQKWDILVWKKTKIYRVAATAYLNRPRYNLYLLRYLKGRKKQCVEPATA